MNRKLFLCAGIRVIHNKLMGNGYIYNIKTGKEYFLNNAGIKILDHLVNGDNKKINQRYRNYIDQLVNTKIITYYGNEPKGIYRAIATKTPLKSVQFELSKKCNLRCVHCYIPDYSTKEDLRLSEILDLIEECANLGVINFDITGGEPFINKDINKILYYINKYGMKTTIFTNGTILTDRILETLRNVNIEKLKISIDGYDSASHDMVRGKGSYERTMTNIKKLLENGIRVEINTVLHKKNIAFSKKIIADLEALNIPYHVDRYVPMQEDTNDDMVISDEEYLEAIKHISNTKISDLIKKPNSSADLATTFFCGAGNSYVFIKSDGAVGFCPTMPKDFIGGDLKHECLSHIWYGSKFFKRIRNINCRFFDECKVNYICKGGCRSRSQLIYGDINKPDLQMCKLMKELTGVTPPSLIN